MRNGEESYPETIGRLRTFCTINQRAHDDAHELFYQIIMFICIISACNDVFL